MKRALFILWLLTGIAQAASVKGSAHDLSTTGPAAGIHASTETEICIFCHTPHKSSTQAPLWNRFDSTASYMPYGSTTTKATIGQPNGASKLCLSCHDGTVALGMVRSRSTPITMSGGVTTLPSGRVTNLGTDLSDDHPVSFPYNAALVTANGQLKNPPTTGRVHVDSSGNMQCTSCHDAHDSQYGNFLTVDPAGGALCLTCHDKTGWNTASHSTSTKTWNGTGTNPWFHTTNLTTVAANACESCHNPHGAAGKARLLNYNVEENNCYPCHNGNVAAKNIQNEFSKLYVHPIASTTGTHDPTESALVPSGTGHHVECIDCHNPHRSDSTTNLVAGGVTGALKGVPGINSSGSSVTTATYEYEVCFRCHADTAKGPAAITRQFAQLNTRSDFSTGNSSFHSVLGTKALTTKPSLVSPWSDTSIMRCTDCHNNDTSGGPKGPHGSANRQLLAANLSYSDNIAYVTANAALCYKCHSETSILGNQSFPAHAVHTSGAARTACTTCHDPHGVATQSHLINFNTSVVSPRSGVLNYVSTGTRSGYCTLVCHGEQHGSGDHNYP